MTPQAVIDRLKAFGPVLAGALLIMLVVAVRGYPMIFTDTDNYYKQGRNLTLAAARTVGLAEAPPPLDAKAAQARKIREGYAYTSMGARSPFYGVFLYTSSRLGTLWMTALLQALACAWIVRLLWRTMAAGSPAWTYYGLMAALAGFTALPFIAAFAVPDIFAAVAAGSAVLLLVYRDRLSRGEQAGLWLLLFFSLLIHASHLLTAVALLAAAGLLLVVLRAGRREAVVAGGMIAAAIVGVVAVNGGWAAGVKAATGYELSRPPFLTARVLADGPGRAWLNIVCTRADAPHVCKFRANPLDDSDEILWSNIKGIGVFNMSTPAERLAMKKEELGFVLGAFAHDPLGQIGASLKNWGEQLVTVHLDDPVKDPTVYLRHNYWSKTYVGQLLREVGPCTAAGECKPRIGWRDLAALHRGVLLLTLAFLAFRLTRGDVMAAARRLDWNDDRTRMLAAFVLLLAAVVINAAVCGILSGVFARYQARVAWLIPLAAGLAALALAPASAWRREAWEQALASILGVEASPAFVRFAMVGIVGFATDAVVLHALVFGAGLNEWAARLVSFPVAVLVTWGLNRAFTFQTAGQDGRAREAAVYFGVQGAGGVANLGVYSLAMLLVPALQTYLLIPLVLGSAAGLCVTYLGSKHLAFRRAEAPLAAE